MAADRRRVATATTNGPKVGRFFERYLRHRKGDAAGRPFGLEPWQQEFLNEFYELDRHGRRVYRLGILGVPRGNGKTPVAAGLGLYELLAREDAPNVFNVAGAKEQARLLTDFAREFVEDNPKLGSWIVPQRNYLTCDSNHGVMRVLSSEGRLLHGLNPSAVLVDELHGFMLPQQREAYVAMITSLHKRLAYLLTITTAGYDKHTILGEAYDQALLLEEGEDRFDGCLRIRRDRENGVLFWWYGIPESLYEDWDKEELWRLVNPASWVDVAELRKQLHSPGFHELDFKRLHLNIWTASREAWLPSGCWAGLRSDAEIPADGDVYVGVDVGLYHDTTAVSWAHKLNDGRVVVRSRVWSVLGDLPHDVFVPGGRMRLELVGDFLKELAGRYRIREVVFDPALFAAEADRLNDEGVAPMFELGPGTSAMVEAYQRFYAACREGSLTHNNDPVLAAHVEATAADMTERGWRIRKMKSTKVIDACVAAVMAHYRAARNDAPSKYETEGLFMLDYGSELEDELELDEQELTELEDEDLGLEPGELDQDDEDDEDDL